jgi:hypothetical protein
VLLALHVKSLQMPSVFTNDSTAMQELPPDTNHISNLLNAAGRLQHQALSSIGNVGPCADKPVSSQQTDIVHGPITMLPGIAGLHV